jgi:hypothetical protein
MDKQAAAYPMDATGCLHAGKQPERDDLQASPCGAHFRKAWSFTSTPPTRIPDLVFRHRAQFTLTLEPLYVVINVFNYSLNPMVEWFEGSSPGGGWGIFSPPPCPERLWGPPSLLSNGYQGVLSLGVKRPGREADHSPPSSAEVRNA